MHVRYVSPHSELQSAHTLKPASGQTSAQAPSLLMQVLQVRPPEHLSSQNVCAARHFSSQLFWGRLTPMKHDENGADPVMPASRALRHSAALPAMHSAISPLPA